MKRTTIVLVAQWTGWCGPCAAERPLVLTRTGRHSLRSWLSRADDETRPLTLTCRLCGIAQLVPSEADDPEILLDEAPTAFDLPLTAVTSGPAALSSGPDDEAVARTSLQKVAPRPVAPSDPAVGAEAARAAGSGPELQAARSAVHGVLAALLEQRTLQTAQATVAVSASVPVQRSAPSVDGLHALQLLAEGLDLLSPTSR